MARRHDSADGLCRVEWKLGGRAAVVTLSNPPVNALGKDMREALRATLEDLRAAAARDTYPALQLVLFQGAGRGFCAGADLQELVVLISSLSDMGVFERQTALGPLHEFVYQGMELMDTLATLPVYTVAIIHGYALGGGLELAMSCDARVAVEGSMVGLTEQRFGLYPMWGGRQKLERIVGPNKAGNLFLEARVLEARDAMSLGIVDDVFPTQEDAFRFVLSRANRSSGLMNRWPRRDKRSAPLSSFDYDYVMDNVCLAVSGGEPAKKIRAFLDKKDTGKDM